MHANKEECAEKNNLTLNIYSYLRSALQRAIFKNFPDILIKSQFIPLFFKSPYSSADLNTPVALKIASLRKMPVGRVAEQILSSFEWNEKFVTSDPDLSQTVSAGFICFRTSLPFQYNALKSAASDINDYSGSISTNLNNLYHIFDQTHSLLQYSKKIISSDNIFEPEHFDLLNNPDERQLIRLIAVSKTEELYSSGAAQYFLQRISYILNHYIGTVPVFSSNDQLSFSRVILIRASHNHLTSLVDSTFKTGRI